MGGGYRELWKPGTEEKKKNEPCVMSKEESDMTSAWRILWRLVWGRKNEFPSTPKFLTGVIKDRGANKKVKRTIINVYTWEMGFPGGALVKTPSANARDTGLIPGSERSPGGGNGTPVFLPGKSHRQRSLVGYHPRCSEESDTAEHDILIGRGKDSRPLAAAAKSLQSCLMLCD